MKLKNLQEFFELRQYCPFCKSRLLLHSPIGLTFKQDGDILFIYYNNSLSTFCTVVSNYYNSININIITNEVMFDKRHDGFFLEEDRAYVLRANLFSLERECKKCLYRGIAVVSIYSEEKKFINPRLREDQFILKGYPIYMSYENNRTYVYNIGGSLRKTFDGIIFDLKDISSIEERLETLELFG